MLGRVVAENGGPLFKGQETGHQWVAMARDVFGSSRRCFKLEPVVSVAVVSMVDSCGTCRGRAWIKFCPLEHAT